MITIYTNSNRFFRKYDGLNDGRVVSITKNVYDSTVDFFVKPLKLIEVSIRWMLNGNFLKLRMLRILMMKTCNACNV